MNAQTILAILNAVRVMRDLAATATIEGGADGTLTADELQAIRERADVADARWDDVVADARRELEGRS